MCVGRGGGITNPLLSSTDHQEKMALWSLPTHAGARKLYPYTKSFSLYVVDLLCTRFDTCLH